MNAKRQLIVFFSMLLLFVALTIVTLVWFPMDLVVPGQEVPAQTSAVSFAQGAWIYGLVILAVYGLLGLAGFGFSRKIGLPGIFRENAGVRNWIVNPMVLGIVGGIVLIVFDRLFAWIGRFDQGISHPEFPLSIIASATAGIGEEILFRTFVFGLWAFLLNLILRRWGAKNLALSIANVIAALAFGAGHLPALLAIFGTTSLSQIPPLVLVEVFLLNGFIGLVAGGQYIRNGLVAASGVHFWTDIVWHVIWPVLAGL